MSLRSCARETRTSLGTRFETVGLAVITANKISTVRVSVAQCWSTNLDFPDAAGRAPEKQFCFSPEGADSPYKTYFPIACTTVPFLQPIGLAMVD